MGNISDMQNKLQLPQQTSCSYKCYIMVLLSCLGCHKFIPLCGWSSGSQVQQPVYVRRTNLTVPMMHTHNGSRRCCTACGRESPGTGILLLANQIMLCRTQSLNLLWFLPCSLDFVILGEYLPDRTNVRFFMALILFYFRLQIFRPVDFPQPVSAETKPGSSNLNNLHQSFWGAIGGHSPIKKPVYFYFQKKRVWLSTLNK